MCPKCIKTSKALRAEQNVDTEASTLPDDRLQQIRRRQSDLVVAGKEHLELIEHKEDAGDLVAGRLPEPLHPGLSSSSRAQQFRALRDFGLQRLQDAQPELAVRFDGDDLCVG